MPIFSLPQEWLWCESWCSLESKKDAKTIDLCNNPLKKEPKLDMAKRIVAGEVRSGGERSDAQRRHGHLLLTSRTRPPLCDSLRSSQLFEKSWAQLDEEVASMTTPKGEAETVEAKEEL